MLKQKPSFKIFSHLGYSAANTLLMFGFYLSPSCNIQWTTNQLKLCSLYTVKHLMERAFQGWQSQHNITWTNSLEVKDAPNHQETARSHLKLK